jgi:hypothetical protein
MILNVSLLGLQAFDFLTLTFDFTPIRGQIQR